MTASPGREVDRNLLRGAALGSAQAGADADDAGGQDLGDLAEALGGSHKLGIQAAAHRGPLEDSPLRCCKRSASKRSTSTSR
jgi:hypothetical protein